MNKKLFLVTILVSLIFYISQLRYFHMSFANVETHLFVVFFILCIILSFVALIIYLKLCSKTLNIMETSSFLIILISMLFISLIANGLSSWIRITVYLGYASILLGGIGYFKNKNKVNFSFIVWGLFILLWVSNLYNAFYGGWSYTNN